jgi:hypothetical protein
MSQRVLVNAARVVLVMLVVAGLAMAALGVIALLRSDTPEATGWLRAIFGRVFAVVAFGMAAVLGIPSAVGVRAPRRPCRAALSWRPGSRASRRRP